jgi:hypothetical protein
VSPLGGKFGELLLPLSCRGVALGTAEGERELDVRAETYVEGAAEDMVGLPALPDMELSGRGSAPLLTGGFEHNKPRSTAARTITLASRTSEMVLLFRRQNGDLGVS